MSGIKVFNEDPEQLKPLIHGSSGGSPTQIAVNSSGRVNTLVYDINGNIANFNSTAFKELRVAEMTAVTGWTFNYNINSDLVTSTTTGSGTITTSNSKAVLQTTAATSSSAKIATKNVLRYLPGIGALVRFTASFTTGVAGSTQIIGVGDDTDGFFFGYNGSSFGILRRQNGSDFWIAQSSWNGDKFDGTGVSGVTLDQTKGNVYFINYQWLGYGYVVFGIEDPSTGDFIIAHSIQYANTSTDPTVFNPTFPIMAEVKNTTNNTNITLQTLSAMGFVEGKITAAIDTRNSISSYKTGVSSEVAILSIRNKSTYQAKTNRVRIRLDYLSVSVDGTKNAEVRLIKNTTLGGTPSWTDINTNTSVIEYDTSATTVTGGDLVISTQVAKNISKDLFLDSLDLILSPGDTLTVSASTSRTAEVGVALSWREMF
ncbi:hypothetical protein BHF71_02845 [Vulcanibacillus modesticaldus]|uniref:Uncharacterized protein n=1 Tax=Vulcanibacillus modesticaldus TaxID=337097 RepID=A0A1D2YT75_9BACI|nr:hypothetical protein [Vulcanibacillus modesticaldus]OEF98881.1 hypothetical protein BHF71_02845 [Vulcanibacillus modesticaldus]